MSRKSIWSKRKKVLSILLIVDVLLLIIFGTIYFVSENYTPSENKNTLTDQSVSSQENSEELQAISETIFLTNKHSLISKSDSINSQPSNDRTLSIGSTKTLVDYMVSVLEEVISKSNTYYLIALPSQTLGYVDASVLKSDDKYSKTPFVYDYWMYETGGPKPDLLEYSDFTISYSKSAKRFYIKSDDQTIYTMLAQDAKDEADDETPSGTFEIESEMGTTFWGYYGGANYWVSWLNHGEFLIHSPGLKEPSEDPILDTAFDYNIISGQRLGVENIGASEGCIQLSVADAKWFYEQALYGLIPTGTPFIISE